MVRPGYNYPNNVEERITTLVAIVLDSDREP